MVRIKLWRTGRDARKTPTVLRTNPGSSLNSTLISIWRMLSDLVASAAWARLTAFGANYRRIHANSVEAAEETSMFDFHAAVHHHFKTGLLGTFGGFFLDHAELHPDHLRAHGDGLLDDVR